MTPPGTAKKWPLFFQWFNEWKPMGWMRRDFIGVPFSGCCFFSSHWDTSSFRNILVYLYIYIYILYCAYIMQIISYSHIIYTCIQVTAMISIWSMLYFCLNISRSAQIRGRQIRVLVLAFPASYSEQGPRAKLWRVEGGGGKKVEMRWWWLQPGRRTW